MTRDSIPRRLRDRARHVRRVAGAAVRAGAGRVLSSAEVADARFGEALVAELDQLKGMAMKVGQILSYMDGAIPDETREALQRLQRGVEPVDFAVIRGVLEDELGGPIEEHFERLDQSPVAAASIGQVHRGRVGGVEVAVKVQYPGVRDTFEADVRNLRRIAGVARLATVVDTQAIVDDLRDRLLEECDYLAEARWQRAFADAFADVDGIDVPDVLDARSTSRVLTTTWVDGLPLEAFRDLGSHAARQRAGRGLATVAWRGLFVLRTIHADPHPGNTIFHEDGSITLLDFGSVRRFEDDFVDATARTIRALRADDTPAFRQAVLDAGLVGRERGFDWEVHEAMERHGWGPYLEPPMTLDGEWLRESARFGELTNPNIRRLAVPPAWAWLQRLQFGLHAVLTRLGAGEGLPEVLRAALDAPARPLEV